MTKLNVGCGTDIKKGYINIDTHKENGADLIHKLPDKLPFGDNSVDEIYCSHVLEDFGYEYIDIMKDFHRVLKKGGILHIRVPYKLAVSNPYHVRFFDKTSFDFFISPQANYGDYPLKFSKIIKLKTNKRGLFGKMLVSVTHCLPENQQNKISKNCKIEGWLHKTFKIMNNIFSFKKFEVEVILKK